jgi:hypothetical protein
MSLPGRAAGALGLSSIAWSQMHDGGIHAMRLLRIPWNTVGSALGYLRRLGFLWV